MYGGIPSPNPSYPQDMRVATGDNNVIVCNKNLFNGIWELGYIDGNTGQNVSNNTLIRSKDYIEVKELTNYKFSIDNPSIVNMLVYEYKADFTYNLSINKGINIANDYLTTNANTKYIRFRPSYLTTDTSLKCQLEKGTVATSYVAHQEQKAPLNLGMRNYFTASIELGSLNDSTGATETNNNIIRSNDFIRVTPNGTYSINNDNGYHTYIYEYNSSKTFLSVITTDTSNPKTFTVSIYTRYIKIRTAEGENDTTTKFWLNSGKSASDTYFPPNTLPIRLCGIEDFNDLIIGKPNNWKILRVIRELNLLIDDMDNLEDYPGWKNQLQLVNDLGLTSSNTRLEEATQLLNNIGATHLTANANDNGTFWISRASFGNEYTQTYWKTNYQDLIFQLHYRITNPTAIVEEPITIPIVVEQLNNIYNLTSYDKQTNITTTHILGGAQMIISASVEEGD